MQIERGWVPILCLSLCSCTAALSGKPSYNSVAILPDRAPAPGVSTADAGRSGIPTSCDSQSSTDPTRRNTCLDEFRSIIDQSYREYEISLTRNVSNANFALNVGTLGVTTAATVTGNEATKTVLAAIATGLTGVRTAISEDILLKSSVQTLILRMRADRAGIGTRMEQGKRRKIADYTMGEVRRDLVDYYYAGTITNALASNNAQTGADAKNCEEAQAKAAKGGSAFDGAGCDSLSAPYNYGAAGKALQAIFDDETTTPPGRDRIERCITDLKLAGPGPYLINTASEDDKNRVLTCVRTTYK